MLENASVHRSVETFEAWRDAARTLLAEETPPEAVCWEDASQPQAMLFLEPPDGQGREARTAYRRPQARVTKRFLSLAEHAAAHTDPERWTVLYRLLWRLTHGAPDLLSNPMDPDVAAARRWEKAVRREVHHMECFVRFRKCKRAGRDWYVAWFQPEYRTLPLTAPFFLERFAAMPWAILTPDASLCWDGERLREGPGAPREAAPSEDELEALWSAYYGAAFNPARANLALMRQHMPERYWRNMPETRAINRLAQEAPERVARMAAKDQSWPTAEAFLPDRISIASLKRAAAGCEGCPLYQDATHTVFGAGPARARLVLVGEQPGNEEDLQGKPFVGPAGALLNELMAQAGVDQKAVYITNAVKHFKFLRRGETRLHQSPRRFEVNACRAWLEKELEVVKPAAVLCLGATAARALLGPSFRITKQRGNVLPTEWCGSVLATFHPSAALRAPDPAAREQKKATIVEDLRRAGEIAGIIGAA